jgi:hypothetical protein
LDNVPVDLVAEMGVRGKHRRDDLNRLCHYQ